MRTILKKGGGESLRPGFMYGGGNCAGLSQINEQRVAPPNLLKDFSGAFLSLCYIPALLTKLFEGGELFLNCDSE